jgi:hypothetical protein
MSRVLTIAVFVLIAASSALADVIELKTGQRVEGTLKQATPASVSVEVGGQTITFTGDKVRAIYFGAAPAPQARPSARSSSAPDRFVLWSTMNGTIMRRPEIKNVGVHDSEKECDKMAAELNKHAEERGQAPTGKATSLYMFYQCLPVGVQPTP